MTRPACAYDVIVVGGGGAGLTAALTAARLGRSVILFEKNPVLGGTTRLSVGSISVCCTPHQRAAGISDIPSEHFEDMGKLAGKLEARDNLALRQRYVEEAPEAFRFLLDLGLEFMGPVAEPPHRHPRLHNVIPHSGSIVRGLLRACRGEGVAVVTSAKVARLVTVGGCVTGVALADGQNFVATRGVVLASGDYSSAGPELKSAFLPPGIAGIEGINPTSTGDGQRMGREIGSEVLNPDLAWGPELRFVPPARPSLVSRIPPVRFFARLINWAVEALPQRLLRPFLMSFVTTFLAPSHGLLREGGILVNARGERFCEETLKPETAVARQPDGVAWILLSGDTARQFDAWPHFVSTAPGVAYAYLSDYRRNRGDICHVGDNLAKAAAKAGLPAGALERTVADYNASDRGGRPEIAGAPFCILGPLKAWIAFTEGGLRVAGEQQVTDGAGDLIPGLYAAGSAGQGGLILEGHGHHLGWAVVSGRIAGRAAAFAATNANAGTAAPEVPAVASNPAARTAAAD